MVPTASSLGDAECLAGERGAGLRRRADLSAFGGVGRRRRAPADAAAFTAVSNDDDADAADTSLSELEPPLGCTLIFVGECAFGEPFGRRLQGPGGLGGGGGGRALR